jgi:hypothetical protein
MAEPPKPLRSGDGKSQVAYNAINEAAAVLHCGGFFYVHFIRRIGKNKRLPDRQECIYRM